ncbi:DUF1080 domain-containing protein [bacterium]|nr:DUF1080 domain-containing protein [bacterium]
MLRPFFSIVVAVVLAGAAWGQNDPITPKKKMQLFNGQDLSGWQMCLPGSDVDPGTVWRVADGVISCSGTPFGYIRTRNAYTNYRLHVEWRWSGKPGNSGVLLHISGPDRVWPKCIEGQLMSGNAGDFYSIGGTTMKERPEGGRHIPKKKESSEKPVGDWNSYDITCASDTITLVVNGVEQNRATATSVSAGMIGLQSEGAPIQFRNVYLEPLR